DKAEGALKGLEQAENLRARGAIVAWQKATITKEQARERIDRAIQGLERLLQFGETAERFGLLGSAWKRRALVTDDDERKHSVQQMVARYQSMANLRETASNYSSSLLNWLTSEVVLGWLDPTKPNSVEKYREMILAEAASAGARDPDFWTMVLVPDCKLVLALSAKEFVDKDWRTVAEGYLRARKWAGSEREVRTVIEHLQFLLAMAAADPKLAGYLQNCIGYINGSAWPEPHS
ncbi:MAG: hypothetical protein JO022_11460, partial [Acidobacteriaceae bacterium]|nr:hypothetical protein [Acidobacteriaceae bacterium]